MNCSNDGVLRAFLDRELVGAGLGAAERHIQECEACRTRLRVLESQASVVRENLAALDEGARPMNAELAYERYLETHAVPVRKRFGALWLKPALGWTAAVCAVVLVLTFGPSRTWAQKILEMLRVEKIAVVPVDFSSITGQNGEHSLAQFISDNVIVTMKPGKPAAASDGAAASQIAGFAVKTLDSLGAPHDVSVSDETAFQMTLNRDRIQAVLEQAGRSDVQIPESVDGSLVAVHVRKAVHLTYGSCKAGANDCVQFMEMPTPIISVPSSLNIAAVAEAGLQIAGMSAAEAHAFAQTVDWSSTLVIPIPRAGASYREVSVDGVTGTLIETLPRGNFVGRSELIWVKNGIVYSVEARGTADRLLAAVESLS